MTKCSGNGSLRFCPWPTFYKANTEEMSEVEAKKEKWGGCRLQRKDETVERVAAGLLQSFYAYLTTGTDKKIFQL